MNQTSTTEIIFEFFLTQIYVFTIKSFSGY